MATGNSVVACMLCSEQSIRKSNASSSMLTLRMHVAHVVILYCSNHGKALCVTNIVGIPRTGVCPKLGRRVIVQASKQHAVQEHKISVARSSLLRLCWGVAGWCFRASLRAVDILFQKACCVG